MNSEHFSHQVAPDRLGFHYNPDGQHYRQEDLQRWLPELLALGAGWLVLDAPGERAIPEYFLKGLLEAEIQPVVHFRPRIGDPSQFDELPLLFDQYARWGVKWAILFDRPNVRQAWPASIWSQSDPVEHYLDRYILLAERALRAGLQPVFSPLEPGGHYWDLAFLKAALQGLKRRGKKELLDRLVVACEAKAGNRPLDWGAGGPQRWPKSRPYVTPNGSQDQRGFRIFDWYQAVIEAELGERRPLMGVRAGCRLGSQDDPCRPPVDLQAHTERNLSLAGAALGLNLTAKDADPGDDPLPGEVVSCNFWLLWATQGSPYNGQAWYPADGEPLPVAKALKQLAAGRQASDKSLPVDRKHPIAHYLLLPAGNGLLPDQLLGRLLPFIQEHQATAGFSPVEARLARRVTLAGGVQVFPAEIARLLEEAGCQVERILPDGTIIAL